MNILIHDCLIVPMDGGDKKYFAGAIGITDNRIAMVSPEDAREDHTRRVEQFIAQSLGQLQRIDGRGMIAMPGLVNTHNHASMSLMRGFADDIPLFRWLNEYIWPFEAGLTPQAVKLGAQLAIAEMLCGGTTTFADMYWMEAAVAEAVHQSGIRAVLSPTFTDDNFDTFLSDFDNVLTDWVTRDHGRITAMIAPHSPYTCSPEHLRECIELSRQHDIPLYTHVAETRDEIDVIRRKYDKTPVEFLHSVGFFSRPSIAVHCVHVTDKDIAIFHDHDVRISHNPQSNIKLASGIAPVADMLGAGLTVGLGTDGPCSNNDLDMWEELRTASFLQKVSTGDATTIPAYQALEMATINGARTLHLDHKIGSLEEGKLADIILINTQKPHMSPQHDPIANLAYCAKAADVQTTIVNGKIITQNQSCLTLQVSTIIPAAQEYIQSRK